MFLKSELPDNFCSVLFQLLILLAFLWQFWHFSLLSLFADARFFDLSSTLYSDKRQRAARFWHLWYNTTRLYSNRPGQQPYDGNLFGEMGGAGGRGKGGNKKGGGGGGRRKTPPPPPPTPRPRPPRPTPAAEVTPTVGVYFRTDSQFSVEQSVATQVYDKASYGRCHVTKRLIN